MYYYWLDFSIWFCDIGDWRLATGDWQLATGVCSDGDSRMTVTLMMAEETGGCRGMYAPRNAA